MQQFQYLLLLILLGCVKGRSGPYEAAKTPLATQPTRLPCGLHGSAHFASCCLQARASATFQPLCPGTKPVNNCDEECIKARKVVVRAEIEGALQDPELFQIFATNWAATFGKRYATREEQLARQAMLKESLKEALARNEADPNELYQLDRFSDQARSELALKLKTMEGLPLVRRVMRQRQMGPKSGDVELCGLMSSRSSFRSCCKRSAEGGTCSPICGQEGARRCDVDNDLASSIALVNDEIAYAKQSSAFLRRYFNNWCTTWGKRFRGSEYRARMAIFSTNLDLVVASNTSPNNTALFAPNGLSDKTPEELRSPGLQPPPDE